MGTCPYPGCEYQDDQHRPYARKRDGIPSVTAISSALDVGDKARAFAWSASLTAADMGVHHTDKWWNLPNHPCEHNPKELCQACRYIRSEFDRVWRAKAAKGSHVHHLALSWANGEDVETDAEIEPYLDALEKFYLQHNPEWVVLERTILGETPDALRYRGQLDAICLIDCPTCGKRCRWLVDLKTGSYYPIEQTLQMVAYRCAKYLTTWQDKEEHIDIHMPAVDHAGVLLLGSDGVGRLVELPATPEAFATFCRLRAGYEWAKQMERWAKEHPLETEEIA